MIAPFTSVVVFENQTPDLKVELRLAYSDRLPGHYKAVVPLLPSESKEVSASKFGYMSAGTFVFSILRIFVDGGCSGFWLHPRQINYYAKFVFSVNSDGQLVITAIEGKRTDLCRLKGFGFLGRTYAGRRPVVLSVIDLPRKKLGPDEVDELAARISFPELNLASFFSRCRFVHIP